jgi:hypothetical protein
MRCFLGFLFAGLAVAQVSNPSATSQADHGPQPIYRVEVVARTVKAVNYGHRTIPTKVDLKGTVLAPEARGEARVESKRGAVEIEVQIARLDPPSRFGNEYLTYVLWAITPEGRSTNIGELVLDPSNKGKLKVSSDLQAFALIVTAEPYFAVTQPGDVVVMENVIRPDTVGRVEEVAAKYELMPRGHYTYVRPSREAAPSVPGKKLSMDQYEAMLALYRALNAIQIARAAGADRAASETMHKAVKLYEDARNLHSQNAASREVVMMARQSAQTAEDARAISAKHRP